MPKPEEIPVKNVTEYLQAINDRYAKLFRGVSKKGSPLQAKIYRDTNELFMDFTPMEILFLNKFHQQAIAHIAYFDYVPKNNWEWLMLAQHYGMQTRLLDWTANPLVALYFACEKDYDVGGDDGQVYRLDAIDTIDTIKFPDPFSIPGDCYIVNPPHISPRIVAQSVYFTISKDQTLALEPTRTYHEHIGNYHKLIVPKDKKLDILEELNLYGIHQAMLFPGLDGLSKKLNFDLLLEVKRPLKQHPLVRITDP